MPSTFFGIEIGQRALAASQFAQDITGQNIANANTPGYSAQGVNLVASDPYTLPDQAGSGQPGMLGTGVIVGAVTRARDQFLDVQVRSAMTAHSTQTSQNGALTQMQSAFGEPSDYGINNTLGNFFQSFTNLANNPEDLGVRASVIQSGQALASVFQTTQQALTGVGQELTSNVASDMSSLNSYGQQIASLNVSIRQATASHESANDLMDQRDTLIDKVATLASVTVTAQKDGTVNVAVGTSDLVNGTDSFTLSLTGPNSLTARGDLRGGEIAGLTQAQTALAGYQSQLDSVASAVITQVNSVHQSGAGLDGTTGLAFFTGTSASTIAVNPALASNPQKLAAAALPAGGGNPPPGDASNAQALANLQNAAQASGPLAGTTFQGYYQQFVSNLAGQTAATKTASDSAGANLTQLTQQRDSVSGVSTDTEMVNLLKYQRAYQSAARVVSTMDSMIGTLIDSVGH